MKVFKDWSEVKEYLRGFNKEHNITSKGSAGPVVNVVVVITEDSFPKEYSLEERSYRFTNKEKAFIEGQNGYSIFSNSLDESDCGVRLEQYLKDEQGGPNGWKIEKIYIESVREG